ncbi:tetratricopeptide repeat protein [Streptomyces sp. NPDC004267]|uniref:tetratricopeptide repeat protein n=1 Tax=Streptomyces sp. NPDC004267 TaxID=3364694 RepID=UPI0036959D74
MALVWLHEAVEVDGVPVRWGTVGGTEPVRYEGAGFPLFAREAGEPEFEYLRGELLPVATGGGRLRVLDTRAWPTSGRGERPWAGASGSAVFCHGRLVGVAVEDGPKLGWRRLYAEPVDELFMDPGFTDLLERHGGLGRLPLIEEIQAGDATVDWPRQVGVIPQVSGLFQHRTEVDTLARALDSGRQAGLGQHSVSPGSRAQVVAGTGGVGKTQLAAHYATAVRRASGWLTTPGGSAANVDGADLLVWVDAGSRQAVISAFAQAAAITDLDAPTAVNGGGDEQEQAARRFLAWTQTTARRWLVILDDVPEPGVLAGWWPSTGGRGRVIVTTRSRQTAFTHHGTFIHVGLFTPGEALNYLRRALDDPSRASHTDDEQDLAGLAEDLGHLPLALAQAAAFLLDTGRSVRAYRDLLADRARNLREITPDIGGLPDDQRRTVAALWDESVALADSRQPAGVARPLLQLLSVLDGSGIPAHLPASEAALAYLQVARTPGHGAIRKVDAEDMYTSLAVLDRLNLINPAEAPIDAAHGADGEVSEQRMVRMHQLIQRVVREADSDPSATVRAGADALVEVWQDTEHSFETGGAQALAQRLRANAAALEEADVEMGTLWEPTAHEVLYIHGKSLGAAGGVDAAAQHFTRMVEQSLRRFGPEHPDTLRTRFHLARWQGESGQLGGALAALEGVLADRLRLLGPDHRDTLTARSDLAHWRGEAGDLAGAEAAYKLLLVDQLRVLGSHHRDIITTRGNLARWRGIAGDPAGAAAAYAKLLPDARRVLGPDHLHTLLTRNNLARWQGEAGDAEGAVTAFEALLPDMLRVLGPDHPQTMVVLSNLASWRGRAGDPVGAVVAFEEVLADRVRVLGPDHPGTLTARYNLAHWRGRTGDVAGAVAAFETLLPDILRVLGSDHHLTLTTRNSLALVQGEAGDPVGAVAALEEVLADRLRVLGPDHPNTLITRDNLAYWRAASAANGGDATTSRSV